MNRKQKIVVGVGITIVFIMGLFPPWLAGTHHIGYHLICATNGTIDTNRLLIQWATVIIVVAGLVLILKREDRA